MIALVIVLILIGLTTYVIIRIIINNNTVKVSPTGTKYNTNTSPTTTNTTNPSHVVSIPSDTTTPGSTPTSICSMGNFIDSNNQCVPCPMNTYSLDQNSHGCNPCPDSFDMGSPISDQCLKYSSIM